eukprot:TRINITY_DN5696_c0_g1_i9.p2 TRINITY_DN5696_c0_g1~~TRINITY_DN5696_c0_g1_i9.p2  ORF type:complete len:131 (-),score=3.01 TRINITY_DN5696_c0_g1_i9:60-452(-)
MIVQPSLLWACSIKIMTKNFYSNMIRILDYVNVMYINNQLSIVYGGIDVELFAGGGCRDKNYYNYVLIILDLLHGGDDVEQLVSVQGWWKGTGQDTAITMQQILCFYGSGYCQYQLRLRYVLWKQSSVVL